MNSIEKCLDMLSKFRSSIRDEFLIHEAREDLSKLLRNTTGGRFKVGDRARKVGGSYQATGTIRAVFLTRNGEQRFVFDFDDPPGLPHIFGPAQIEPMVDE